MRYRNGGAGGHPAPTYAYGGGSTITYYEAHFEWSRVGKNEWIALIGVNGIPGLSLNGVSYGDGGNTDRIFNGAVQWTPGKNGKDGTVFIVSTW